jgi:hypothetical protein
LIEFLTFNQIVDFDDQFVLIRMPPQTLGHQDLGARTPSHSFQNREIVCVERQTPLIRQKPNDAVAFYELNGWIHFFQVCQQGGLERAAKICIELTLQQRRNKDACLLSLAKTLGSALSEVLNFGRDLAKNRKAESSQFDGTKNSPAERLCKSAVEHMPPFSELITTLFLGFILYSYALGETLPEDRHPQVLDQVATRPELLNFVSRIVRPPPSSALGVRFYPQFMFWQLKTNTQRTSSQNASWAMHHSSSKKFHDAGPASRNFLSALRVTCPAAVAY